MRTMWSWQAKLFIKKELYIIHGWILMLASFILAKELINHSVVCPTESFLFCAGYFFLFVSSKFY